MATCPPIFAWGILQRSLVGYSPWDSKELDRTEQLSVHTHTHTHTHTQPQSKAVLSQECHGGKNQIQVEYRLLIVLIHKKRGLCSCYFALMISIAYQVESEISVFKNMMKAHDEGNICIIMAVSHCCMAETNIIL